MERQRIKYKVRGEPQVRVTVKTRPNIDYSDLEYDFNRNPEYEYSDDILMPNISPLDPRHYSHRLIDYEDYYEDDYGSDYDDYLIDEW